MNEVTSRWENKEEKYDSQAISASADFKSKDRYDDSLNSKDLENTAHLIAIETLNDTKFMTTTMGYVLGKLQDIFIAGAKWQAKQMPMPEDTVLFQKGVAEGRRLEKDDVMKDLPKWKKNAGALRYDILEDEHGRYIQHDGYKLYFDDLLKLPKEDEK